MSHKHPSPLYWYQTNQWGLQKRKETFLYFGRQGWNETYQVQILWNYYLQWDMPIADSTRQYYTQIETYQMQIPLHYSPQWNMSDLNSTMSYGTCIIQGDTYWVQILIEYFLQWDMSGTDSIKTNIHIQTHQVQILLDHYLHWMGILLDFYPYYFSLLILIFLVVN